MRRSDPTYVGLAIAAIAAAVWLSNLLTIADAAAQACPDMPAAPPASMVDAAAIELRELRRETAGSCVALHGKLDDVLARTAAVRDRIATDAEAGQATLAGRLALLGPKVDALGPKVDATTARLDQPLALTRGGATSDPLYVQSAASGSTSTEAHGQSDSDPTWVRLASPSVQLWQAGIALVVGVVLGTFFFGQLLRRLL